MSEWSTELAAAIRGAQEPGEPETRLLVAEIQETEPFSIRVMGQTITSHLHIHPALLYGTELKEEELEAILTHERIPPPAWFTFLKGFYNRFVVGPGSQVIVLQLGIDFYVLGVVA